MSYCLNPNCQQPQNPDTAQFCQHCGSKILLGDRYRAIKPIGVGGFGCTFLGVDEYKPSKPRCVIKQFRPQDTGTRNSEKAAELFRLEAVQLEELGKHPQIPDLLAHFEQDNRQYLVQEYIDGQNLARELDEEGAFNETQIRQLLADLLPVLQFVHDRQVIHRDIKPENIIRRRISPTNFGKAKAGELVLVDFGASKSAAGSALDRTGTVIGSAGYAAPEQAFGRAVFASDLYSLGVTCVHLLTQVPPFDLFDSREGKWVWRDYLVDNPVSPQLGRVLDKMLNSAIARRYQGAAEVLADLNRQPTAAAKPLPPEPAAPPLEVKGAEILQSFQQDPHQRRVGISYGLWAAGFVGFGGLHRFYNGKIFSGLLWFCTYNLFGVGQVLDLFLIPTMAEEYERKMKAKMGLSSAGVPLTEPAAIAQTVPLPTRDRLILKLLQAARARGGKLSLTQAVMDTGVSFSEVKSVLQEMAVAGHVSIGNDPATGIVIYQFNEL